MMLKLAIFMAMYLDMYKLRCYTNEAIYNNPRHQRMEARSTLLKATLQTPSTVGLEYQPIRVTYYSDSVGHCHSLTNSLYWTMRIIPNNILKKCNLTYYLNFNICGVLYRCIQGYTGGVSFLFDLSASALV